ncbi:VOC family protein [Vibrio sp. WXL103]|uniref:VOC family protein n=1 Tax=Vibrio sp. WXL103 TaxID=3450710 RepID=UPI003EC4BD7C
MTSLDTLRLDPRQMLEDLPQFMQKITQLAEMLDIDLSPYQADHIALRINDPDIAEQARLAWRAYGEEISSAEINHRPIIVSRFHQPVTVDAWQIECLELPFPAKGKLYPQQGWEHVEFVIPSDAQTVEDFVSELERIEGFSNLQRKAEQLGATLKLSSPKGEGERLANPTLAIKHQDVCIKLHPHSLRSIVASEQD